MRLRKAGRAVFPILALLMAPAAGLAGEPIDRRALVTRHNIELREADPLSPLSVGNGQFCFTADVTGLQSFEQEYLKGVALGTMADWAWHSFPNPGGFNFNQALVLVDAGGRQATYPIRMNTPATEWLRANPHRFSLGQIGLAIAREDGTPARLEDLKSIRQRLDLWQGVLASEFEVEGRPVRVETVCHPRLDAVAARVESPLVAAGRLKVFVAYPYPAGAWGPALNDWRKPDSHTTAVTARSNNRLEVRRELDGTRYACVIVHEDGSALRQEGAHRWEILPTSGAQRIRLAVTFAPESPVAQAAASFDEARKAAAAWWPAYWRSGAVVDLSQSKDPRWREVERRVILSQYLMAIQERGKYPSQETGLTCNSWFGKFHLEMHWWHGVHWALWGRADVLERQLEWYRDVLPVMRETAKRQGYDGARWGKMLGPDGRESPSGIGPLLVWQQPHPIYLAELIYRGRKDRATLERYREIVFETARFMASYAVWDGDRQCYNLGPPLLSAREFGGAGYVRTRNPGFELSYWRWGLKTANAWRQRLGLALESRWEHIADHLASLPIREGIYLEQETPLAPDGGHPCMLASLGVLPQSPMVDAKTMERTLEYVLRRWPKEAMWGWDFPMMAMTAARLGRGDLAVEALLLPWPKNRYAASGHNYQRENLPVYLPANGGLLAAIAMMAAGWDGGPSGNAPGFPADGSWVVRWEGLRVAP
jgi:hypothetical protein